ncbi:MAG: hypothetical protein RIQ79_1149, partial [Verrucomicrobiota bacterium]
MTSSSALRAFLCFVACFVATLSAQVPQLINYQGRVAVGTVNFEGTGQFRFALVNATGTTTYWSNDGTSTAGGAPTAAVSLTVTKGLYSVLLGDTALPNMQAVPATVFANSDVRLRVWFNDGVNGSQLLTPDQRIAAVGYAMMAGTVPDGAITGAKLATGAVGSTQLAAGAVGSSQLAAGTVLTGQEITGYAQSVAANTSYLATGAEAMQITLPTGASPGATIAITGAGAGGWSAITTAYNPAVWTAQVASGNRDWRGVASSADGTKLVAVVYDGPIYTSTDSGFTWTARTVNINWSSVASSA